MPLASVLKRPTRSDACFPLTSGRASIPGFGRQQPEERSVRFMTYYTKTCNSGHQEGRAAPIWVRNFIRSRWDSEAAQGGRSGPRAWHDSATWRR